MEITDINTFLSYFAKIKGRTERLFDYIPQDKIEWTPQSGKFTIGDLIRHLALIERKLYAETVLSRPSLYSGCGTEFAEGYEAVIALYKNLKEESMSVFSSLSNTDLQEKCLTPAGFKITTWKWLRALVEHEIHHRGQLYMYLGLLGVDTPPIFGLTSEEVIEKSAER